jgi:hypothetical protein
MVAVDHGSRLSAKQFFERENQIPTWRGIRGGRSIPFQGRNSTSAHQKVDFHLDAIGAPRVVCKIEIPLAQRIVVHAVL